MIRGLALAILVAGCVGTPAKPPPHGVARSWHERTDPVAPGQRIPAQGITQRLVYDPRRGHMLLWESAEVAKLTHDVMWELVPETGWKLLCDPCLGAADAAGKGGRAAPALVHDPIGDRIVLFGGLDENSDERGELWELRDTWSLASQTGDSPDDLPGPRWQNQMVFDTQLGELWLLGGYANGNPITSQTFLLHGSAWRQITPGPDEILSSPGIDSVYDTERHRVLAFENGNVQLDEMWQHTADGWTKLCEGCTGVARRQASLVHLPEYDQTFLIGGCPPSAGIVCESQQIAGTLVLVGDHFETYDAVLPPPRNAPALAYDPGRDVVVMYGGYRDSADHDPDCDSLGNCGGTWELSRD